MKFSSVVQWAVCVATANAASFRAPVVSVARDPLHGFGRESGALREKAITRSRGNSHRTLTDRRRSEKSIRADWSLLAGLLRGKPPGEDGEIEVIEVQEVIDEDEAVEDMRLWVWNWIEKTYTTQISIGTPPQPFNMLLSISDTDTFVPAVKCYYGCGHRNKYSSSSSSTYTSHDDRITLYLLRLLTIGQLAQDTLEIGGASINGQMFGEVNSMVKHAPAWGNYDGMLGLAPSNFESELGILNPFQEMISQNLLDRNIFSLKLPSSGEDTGEILFGDVNPDLYVGDLKTLRIVERPEDLPRLKGRWIVSASSISIGSGFVSLEGYVASIETDFPLIALPEDYVMSLDRYLGMERGKTGLEPPSIDCEKRKALGNLTISLGEHDFTISPWDYTIEMDMRKWREGESQKRCVSAFYPLPQYIDEKYIVLGSAFLKVFYGIFDLDERTVSLAKATSQKPNTLHSEEKLEWVQELKRRRQN